MILVFNYTDTKLIVDDYVKPPLLPQFLQHKSKNSQIFMQIHCVHQDVLSLVQDQVDYNLYCVIYSRQKQRAFLKFVKFMIPQVRNIIFVSFEELVVMGIRA